MMSPKSGVKEVVIPPLEIVAEQNANTQIMNMFKTHKELACFQIVAATRIPYNTVRRRCQELAINGVLECRYVIARVNGRNRELAVYTLKSSQFQRQRA